MTYVIGSKFRKLDWIKDGYKKPWVSRKYERDGQICHDLRCDICGKWYNYSTKDIDSIRREGRWNFKLDRPYHCGNSLCQDYHQRVMQHAISIAKQAYPGLFFDSNNRKKSL